MSAYATLNPSFRRIVTHITTPLLFATALLIGCDSDRTTGAGASPAPDWIGKLLGGNTALTADRASTQEELPGIGHKFQLFGVFADDQDPENPTNDVISGITTTTYPGGHGEAIRNLPPGIKITALTNQLQLKYFFPARSCGGGSPRIQLAIDTDGDGQSNGNAFGYVGHASFGAGCLTGVWDFVDMTDDVPARWDLTQFGLGYHNWETAVTAISAFPAHKVLTGSLVDDSCSFSAPSCGQAYYDLVTVENRTLENRLDTVH
ncbi:MAG TPA: hypothetical protein VFS56_01615 [Gemmatimonadaceae bacterium]|nr:hypothetical protein [Gemmatimonadaceae bacterium]